jgi:hypothetical protein
MEPAVELHSAALPKPRSIIYSTALPKPQSVIRQYSTAAFYIAKFILLLLTALL